MTLQDPRETKPLLTPGGGGGRRPGGSPRGPGWVSTPSLCQNYALSDQTRAGVMRVSRQGRPRSRSRASSGLRGGASMNGEARAYRSAGASALSFCFRSRASGSDVCDGTDGHMVLGGSAGPPALPQPPPRVDGRRWGRGRTGGRGGAWSLGHPRQRLRVHLLQHLPRQPQVDQPRRHHRLLRQVRRVVVLPGQLLELPLEKQERTAPLADDATGRAVEGTGPARPTPGTLCGVDLNPWVRTVTEYTPEPFRGSPKGRRLYSCKSGQRERFCSIELIVHTEVLSWARHPTPPRSRTTSTPQTRPGKGPTSVGDGVMDRPSHEWLF